MPSAAEPMLNQKGRMETDESRPEMPPTESFVHESSGDLREPEIDPGVCGEDDGPEENVVEVRDEENTNR